LTAEKDDFTAESARSSDQPWQLPPPFRKR